MSVSARQSRPSYMKHSALIRSEHDATTVEFLERETDYFKVSLSSLDVHGTARIYNYEPRPVPLAGFFRDLAVHWQGWPGKKEWASLESDLAFTAISDSTGHTTLSARLRSGPSPFDWSLSVVLLLQAGQLESCLLYTSPSPRDRQKSR